MADINTVTLTGRLVRDAERKQSNGGAIYCTFSVANNQYGGKGKDDKVSFFDCVIFGKLSEAIGNYLTKGTQITASGSMQQDRWETGEGKTRSAVKIIVRDIRIHSSGKHVAPADNTQTEQERHEDEIPF